VVECENYPLKQAVGLKATNADCTFSIEDYARFTVEGSGNSVLRGSTLYPDEALDRFTLWEDPNHDPKASVAYVLSADAYYTVGLVGTELNGNVETRKGEEGFRIEVTEGAVRHAVCENGQCIGMVWIDWGQDASVPPAETQPAGTEVFFSKKDLLALAESIGEPPPDAGQIITPPAQSADEGSCAIRSASPKDVSYDVNAWTASLLIGAAMAYRRTRQGDEKKTLSNRPQKC